MFHLLLSAEDLERFEFYDRYHMDPPHVPCCVVCEVERYETDVAIIGGSGPVGDDDG